MDINKSITNLSSSIFINKIKKRGYNIDNLLKSNLINFEKYCRSNPSNDIDKLIDNSGINFNKSIISLIKIFKNNSININYIDYVLIINSLESQDLNNLNRHLIIKWNIVKKKNQLSENKLDYIENLVFDQDEKILSISTVDEKFDYFIENITKFVEYEKNIRDPNLNISLHLLFVINNIQEYLCP